MLQICRRVVAGNKALTISLGGNNSGSDGVWPITWGCSLMCVYSYGGTTLYAIFISS